MELHPSLVSGIFPKSSSLLLCAPSRSGKTSFVYNLLQHKNLYFGDNYFDRVLIVSCNSKIEISLPEVDSLVIEGLYIEEFDLNQVEEGTCLIFDDVSSLSVKISEVLNVALHHLNFSFVAVCVHSVLGSELFRLSSICHRVLFFLGSTSSARSAAYLVSQFFRDRETRGYLEQVLAYCQRHGSNFLVCLNKGADENQSFLALSHLDRLAKSGYCCAYPGIDYRPSEEVLEVMSVDPELARNFDLEGLPANTLVLAPAHLILKAKRELPAEGGDHSCLKHWNEKVLEVERAIEGYFKLNHWSRCKNILREILKRADFCLDPESLILYLKKSHKQRVNLIDFLAFAIRPVAPGEKCQPDFAIYKRFAQALLSKGAPKNLFKNKFLF